MSRRIADLFTCIKKMNDWTLAIGLSLIQSVLSYFYSASFFVYDIGSEVAKRNKYTTTILFFVVMSIFYYFVIKFLRNWKNKKYRNLFKCWVMYFSVLMLILILIWPGVWRNDDMETAMMAKKYMLDGWQHAITSLLYMVSFRLLPFFSGVIILQCALIALLTSYIYNGLLAILKIKKMLWKVILWVPFFLFPVIDNAFYPLRPILYGYVLVLLTYMMTESVLKNKISKMEIITLVMLFVVGISWRSEGLYLILVAVFYWCYLMKKKMLSGKLMAVILMVIFGGWWMVREFENTALDDWHQNSYRVSGTIETAVPLIRRAYEDDENKEELLAINEVVDVEYVIKNDGLRGEVIYWSDGGMKNDYTGEEVMGYLKAILKLGLKYPDVVIKNRLKEFAVTSALIDEDSNVIWDTTANYDDDMEKNRVLNFRGQGGEMMWPWNSRLRKALIRILEGRNIRDYNDKIPTYFVLWNLVIPIICIIIFAMLMFKKRKWAIGLIVASILMKTIIVFVTAPGNYFMYYYAEYLIGYILFAVMFVKVLMIINKRPRLLNRQKSNMIRRKGER